MFRFFFRDYQNDQNMWMWFFADYLCDTLYMVDIVVFKHRLIFMDSGFWVKDKQRLVRNYVERGSFRQDSNLTGSF